MNQQPDKLFREKLEHYHKPVTVSAWNRIEARLDKKNNKGIWLRVAAGLILLAIATVLLWPKKSIETQGDLVAKKSTVKTEAPEKQIVPSEKQAATTETRKEQDPVVRKRVPQQTTPVETAKTNAAITPEIIIASVNEEKIIVQAPINENPDPAVGETVVAQLAETTAEDEGITLVYSAEEVDNKYLDKKSLADATTLEKKPSTLRKLLDKARDLKNNQDAFGDLRQKKNEILALNFKSEKQRSQNK